jgi:hypothetical protein
VSDDNQKAASPEASLSPEQIQALHQAFDFLYSGLREAKRLFETNDDSGREGAIHSVEIVIKFLSLFKPVLAEALHAPLGRLHADLIALNDGTRPAMLRPIPRSGRAPASSAYDAFKGVSVFTVRRLEATGMDPTTARKTVAAQLVKLEIRPARRGSSRGSGQISERTLRGWQEEIAADVGCHMTPCQTLREAERAQRDEVLARMGLYDLPEGSTPDTLLLSRFPVAQIRQNYIDGLASYIERTRSSETT